MQPIVLVITINYMKLCVISFNMFTNDVDDDTVIMIFDIEIDLSSTVVQ